MPKQTFHINRFEGGMNTDFAPEDIPDNSLLDALGISVSNIGRIVMPGDPHMVAVQKDGTTITAEESSDNSGYGLFAFKSDYFTDNSEPGAATEYLAMANGSHIKIWNGAAWNANSGTINGFDSDGFDLGANSTSHTIEPSYYAPNGDLRVCDGKFHHANNFDNNVKWFGFTPKKTYGLGTSDANVEGWNVQDASIEGGYPKDSSGIATNAQLGLGAGDAEAQYINGTNEWGLHMSFVEASDSGSATYFADSTWQPNTEVNYKFYASFVYEDLQEGHPTQIKCHPTLKANADRGASVAHNDVIKFIDRADTGYIFICGIDADSNSINVSTYSGTSGTTGTNHNYSAGDVVYIAGAADSDYNGYHTVSSTNLASQTFEIEASSDLGSSDTGYVSKVGTNLAIYFTPKVKFNGDDTTTFNFGASTVGSATGGNQRITGTRYYWSSSEDGHGDLWLMMDINFEKGVKAYGIGRDEPTVTDYIPMSDSGSNFGMTVDWKANGVDFNVWKHPPKYETYESLNGYSHTSKLDAKWKTAIIANGRAYIGNVKRRQKATFNVNSQLDSGKQAWVNAIDDPTFGDRILKSPVDRFDTFPEEMAIELFGGDDGDSIVKLETFADRLFVFKKNTLHILNIAKDVEILESSHKGIGLDGGFQCQSCLTKTGIAWINSSGAYHYNGESIESLTDNKIESFWKGKTSNHIDQGTAAGGGQRPKAFWLANAADIPSIGFDIESDKLIIHKTTNADGDDEEDVLIYDMKIKAWTWLNEAMDNNENRTNMVNYDGMLIYHEDDDSTDPIFRYNDSPHPPGHDDTTVGDSLRVYTKPYDFGAPLQRKKIYKVYVTYRCEGVQGDDNVQMQYYINGDTSNLYNFTTGATNTFNIGSDDDNVHTTSSVAEFDTTAGLWDTAAFKPATSSEANNVKSFGLYIFNQSGAVDKDFEINDITIVYRTKSVK